MNMLPAHVTGISHPLVRDIYLKKDFGHGLGKHEDVLVIETIAAPKSSDKTEDSFDSYLIDILSDLEELKSQAEARIGHFDRVDIRAH